MMVVSAAFVEKQQLFITECLNPKSESKSFIDFEKIGEPEKSYSTTL